MASKRAQRRKALHVCIKKKGYDTKALAWRAAWEARARSKDHICPYCCACCGKWHIGHRSARKLVGV